MNFLKQPEKCSQISEYFRHFSAIFRDFPRISWIFRQFFAIFRQFSEFSPFFGNFSEFSPFFGIFGNFSGFSENFLNFRHFSAIFQDFLNDLQFFGIFPRISWIFTDLTQGENDFTYYAIKKNQNNVKRSLVFIFWHRWQDVIKLVNIWIEYLWDKIMKTKF